MGTIQQSLDSVARGGVISIDNIPNVLMLLIVHGCVVRGIRGGSKQQLEDVVKLMGSRELLMPVTKTFGFNRDKIIAALKYVASGELIRGTHKSRHS